MPCPPPALLESFLEDGSAEAEFADLESHLESCVDCQGVLRDLSAPCDSWIEPAGDSGAWSGAVADRLANRLRQDSDVDPPQPPASPDPLAAAFRLPVTLGDYELLQVIGRGGMGIVYRARQGSLNRSVAVKMIARQSSNPAPLQRFHFEARSAAGLDHPGIVPIYEVGQWGPCFYYSMAFVPGGTLAEQLAAGPLDARRAAELIQEVAVAVQFAHQRGIIHRDLKPANILLEVDGRAKVTDFGLAKLIGSGFDLTASHELLGTPGYMAPEQVVRSDDVTTATDVYGLGATLYHLLAGRPPFSGDTPAQVLYDVVHTEPPPLRGPRPDISRDLETVVLKCLAKRPQDRYASAGALARDLQSCLLGTPVEARPVSSATRLTRWAMRHPALASTTAVALAALLLGFTVSTYFGLLAQRRSQRLVTINKELQLAERTARGAADEATLQASLAATQANATMRLLESTLYDLQAIVIDDPAQQARRRQLLHSVLKGLDDLNADHISPSRLLRCRANTTLGLAAVAAQLGDDAGQTGATASGPLYAQAVGHFRELLDRDPASSTAAADLVTALTEYGDMLAEAGHWQPAKECFEEALPIGKKLAAAHPDDPLWQGKMVELEVLYAEGLTFTGDRAAGGVVFHRARDRCRRAVESFPEDPFVRGEYVHVLMELGDWHVMQSDPDSALECFQEMKIEATRLAARHPGDASALMDVSTSLERLGDISTSRGDREGGLRLYEESLKIGEAAGRLAPDNDNTQWEVSFGHQKVADAYLRLNRPAESRQFAMQCVVMRRRLAERDPSNPHLHAKLFHALATLSTACERLGDLQGAQRHSAEIIRLATEFRQRSATERFERQLNTARARLERCRQASATTEAGTPGDP